MIRFLLFVVIKVFVNYRILEQEFVQLSLPILEGAAMYLVNCTSDPDICHEQGVTGFPTLHAFRSFSWMDHSDCFTKHTLQNVKYIRREYHGVIRVGYFHFTISLFEIQENIKQSI